MKTKITDKSFISKKIAKDILQILDERYKYHYKEENSYDEAYYLTFEEIPEIVDKYKDTLNESELHTNEELKINYLKKYSPMNYSFKGDEHDIMRDFYQIFLERFAEDNLTIIENKNKRNKDVKMKR